MSKTGRLYTVRVEVEVGIFVPDSEDEKVTWHLLEDGAKVALQKGAFSPVKGIEDGNVAFIGVLGSYLS